MLVPNETMETAAPPTGPAPTRRRVEGDDVQGDDAARKLRHAMARCATLGDTTWVIKTITQGTVRHGGKISILLVDIPGENLESDFVVTFPMVHCKAFKLRPSGLWIRANRIDVFNDLKAEY